MDPIAILATTAVLLQCAGLVTTFILKAVAALPVDESEDEYEFESKDEDEFENDIVVKGHPIKRKNADRTVQSLVRRMDRMKRELQTLHSLERRLDRMHMELESLKKSNYEIMDKEQQLEGRADEAINIYGYNVQAIILFHGLGSVYLQANYTYIGTWISVSTMVSFFFGFAVAYIVISHKIKGMSRKAMNLQRMQRDLQNQVSHFAANIKSVANNDPELKLLARSVAYGGVSDRMDSLNMLVDTLQNATPTTLEFFNSNRRKSLKKVAVLAIIYGLTFPFITSYLLYLVGLSSCWPQQVLVKKGKYPFV